MVCEVRPSPRVVLVARLGWPLMRTSRRAGAVLSTTVFIVSNSCCTPSKGLAIAACSAIQGEYSKTLPRAATNSSLLQAFKTERSIDDILALLPVKAGGAAVQTRLDLPRLSTSPAPLVPTIFPLSATTCPRAMVMIGQPVTTNPSHGV